MDVAGKEGVYRPSVHLERATVAIDRIGGDPHAFVRSHVRRLEALRRAGPHLTRHGFRQALESLKAFYPGIGATVTFGPERHQGLDSVYFTRVEGERWVPITDWTSAVQA